jgi:hypothetical protein
MFFISKNKNLILLLILIVLMLNETEQQMTYSATWKKRMTNTNNHSLLQRLIKIINMDNSNNLETQKYLEKVYKLFIIFSF